MKREKGNDGRRTTGKETTNFSLRGDHHAARGQEKLSG